MKQFVIYKKDAVAPEFIGDDKGVKITGLPAGAVIATGEYQLAVRDSDNVLNESARIDIAGFTVEKATEAAPTNVNVTATADGADVTGE